MKEDYLYGKYQWSIMKELRKRPLNAEVKNTKRK
jgi:hypothetical protein